MDIGDNKFSKKMEVKISFYLECRKCGSTMYLIEFYNKAYSVNFHWYKYQCGICKNEIVISDIKIKYINH